MNNGKPELVAPLCERSALGAIVEAGANALYVGLPSLNMRKGARHASPDDLARVVDDTHKRNARCYVTLNSLCLERELDTARAYLQAIKTSCADAVIAWDMGVVRMAKDAGLRVHLSTQASVANRKALAFYGQFARRVVLARELDLEQIRSLSGYAGVELECFVHGARCVSISGRCYLSHHLCGRSANRGDCAQPCRRAYHVREAIDGSELVVRDQTVFSPKDLCTLPILDLLVESGIHAFKIEGRMRSPEYVVTVTRCYREALDAIEAGRFDAKLVRACLKRLAQVYHRGFSPGYYLWAPGQDDWAFSRGSAATHRKRICGVIRNYYAKKGVAEIEIQSDSLQLGQRILIQGDKTGIMEMQIDSMEIEHNAVGNAQKGQRVGIRTPRRARTGDRVYTFVPVTVSREDAYLDRIRNRIAEFRKDMEAGTGEELGLENWFP